MKRILCLLCALLVALCPVCALAASVIEPTQDFYVNDQANVLSEETEGLIVLNNDQLEEACGAQIVVVTVDTVGVSGMENYAYTLFNQWGIGSADDSNGVLVLLSIEDDDYWTMTGTGLQDDLTAGDLSELQGAYLEPSFAQKDYDTGVRLYFSALFERVSQIERANVRLDDDLYAEWLAAQESGGGYSSSTYTYNNQESFDYRNERSGGGFMSWFVGLIVLLILLNILRRALRGAARPMRFMPWIHVRPPRPRPHHPPFDGGPRPGPRPPHGGLGGGPRPGVSRPSSFSRPGGSRPGGVSRPSSFSRPNGGFGGGRSGGGGGSRGGGAGRGR